ncbi:kinetochore protein NDC80 homolog [Anolis carolinensis]|uniref:Kinetochore protein NDC80 n=1 Tax=Anolis carolinensis TaxID=28377 RepID=G1KI76_ANOCA|nr:PREDICTED: kinetochore protein NDC80 homolog [Anolis carolinensis]XP_008106865.1 PREDICTED: kinetochore protein NDC80 homolog [Anolis carolinensis]XP_008106866.1 PREDICTED: kinetochore protein NDC80 homolog [Anolis carolinensis]|eukprot:XP_003219708.2 PREDICTED: kinetochore protein NDC80 homolog [Anolis carolinensis]
MKSSASTRRTSSRQSIQSLRVPDANKTGLHTPQMQDRRTTFGKYSVGQNTLPTSERRTSAFSKRNSGTGSLRNSQYGAFGTMEKIKDPRPLHDKAFVQQCIRQLSEFLLAYNYGTTANVKLLQSPSVREFTKIFSFIYQFLCPLYEPSSKIEEEIPKIFKELGYPFALSKSSMYTVGAPHTWPQIVGALIWLTDCVKLFFHLKENAQTFDEDQIMGETEEGIVNNKLFFDYVVKCYNHFMMKGDTYEEFDAEIHAKLKELFEVHENRIEALEAEEERLNTEIRSREKERECEPDRLMTLRKVKSTLQTDVKKYEAYLADLELHSSSISQKSKSIDEEQDAAGVQIEALKQETIRLKQICDNQKYSTEDIKRLKCEIDELQQSVNKLTKELEAEQHQLWNEELKYAKGKEAIEATLGDYHKLARKLKLIPRNSENSGGIDFEIKFNPDEGQNCLDKYRIQIHTPLMLLISKTEEEIANIIKTKIGLEDAFEQASKMEAEQNSTVKMLNEEGQKLESLYQQKMKEVEEEEEKANQELKLLEEHMLLLSSGVNDGLSETTKELHESRCRYQVVMQTTSEESRKVETNLQRLLELVFTHVQFVEAYLTEQNAKIEQEFQEFMSENPLADLKLIVDCYKKKTDTLYEIDK